eukprot:4729910-Prymnesium_polylepis.1
MYHHITCPYCDNVFGRVSVQGVSFHKANVCLGHLRCKSACKEAHEALGFDVPELKVRSTQDNEGGIPSSPSLAVEQLNENTTLTAHAIRDLQERLACVEAEKEGWKADREAMLAKDAKREETGRWTRWRGRSRCGATAPTAGRRVRRWWSRWGGW